MKEMRYTYTIFLENLKAKIAWKILVYIEGDIKMGRNTRNIIEKSNEISDSAKWTQFLEELRHYLCVLKEPAPCSQLKWNDFLILTAPCFLW